MKLSKVTFILIIVFFLIFNNLALAEESIILEVEDQLNDDYGPGTYEYPTDKAFQGEGLFDITSFSISEVGEEYRFNISFANLTDPWRSKYGFSLPLIEIYIGKKGTGISDLRKEGANVNLDPEYPWSTLLKISGWWVRAYTPEDINNEEDVWDIENNPADLEDLDLEVKDNTISFVINKDIIGDLKDAHLYVLVGSYDPFGPDNFRSINSDKNSWSFSDISNDNLENAPRVIDILLAEGIDQTEILSEYTEDYPTIVPIKVQSKVNSVLYLPYAMLLVILLLLGLIVMNKKPPVSNNKS